MKVSSAVFYWKLRLEGSMLTLGGCKTHCEKVPNNVLPSKGQSFSSRWRKTHKKIMLSQFIFLVSQTTTKRVKEGVSSWWAKHVTRPITPKAVKCIWVISLAIQAPPLSVALRSAGYISDREKLSSDAVKVGDFIMSAVQQARELSITQACDTAKEFVNRFYRSLDRERHVC